MKSFLLPLTLWFLVGCASNQTPVPVSYEAGFRIIQAKDSSRLYKPGADSSNYLHFRPLDIDVWYPAVVATGDSAIAFREVLGLLEKRANYYAASTVGNGITQQLAQVFCEGAQCSDTGRLLNYRTQSYREARPVKGTYPLVIYMTSYNGMSFENVYLFEAMARKGYVVACISSIGRYPGDMTMKYEDIIEQVRDAQFALQQLKGHPQIDFTKVGIVGYSWGGLAGVILARDLPEANCLVSLDGSEFHHYGEAAEENKDFDGIRYHPDFSTMRLALPYLRLESAPEDEKEKVGEKDNQKRKADSVYDFTEKLSTRPSIYVIDSAQHQDFGCLPDLVRRSGNCASPAVYQRITGLTLAFLDQHLKGGVLFSEVARKEKDSNRIREKSIQ